MPWDLTVMNSPRPHYSFFSAAQTIDTWLSCCYLPSSSRELVCTKAINPLFKDCWFLTSCDYAAYAPPSSELIKRRPSLSPRDVDSWGKETLCVTVPLYHGLAQNRCPQKSPKTVQLHYSSLNLRCILHSLYS